MPKQHDSIINARREYIQKRIKNRKGTISAEVKRISRDIFISERTVYRDLYAVNNQKY